MEIVSHEQRAEVRLDTSRGRGYIDPHRRENPGLPPEPCADTGTARSAGEEVQGVEQISDARQVRRAGVRKKNKRSADGSPAKGVRARHLDRWKKNVSLHPYLAEAVKNPSLPQVCQSIILAACERRISDTEAATLKAYADASPLVESPEGKRVLRGVVFQIVTWRWSRLWRVQCDGYLAQGVIPSRLTGVVKVGDTVEFEATLVPAEGRTSFSWIKRPRDARIVLSGEPN